MPQAPLFVANLKFGVGGVMNDLFCRDRPFACKYLDCPSHKGFMIVNRLWRTAMAAPSDITVDAVCHSA
jgi:hypothetical protein